MCWCFLSTHTQYWLMKYTHNAYIYQKLISYSLGFFLFYPRKKEISELSLISCRKFKAYLSSLSSNWFERKCTHGTKISTHFASQPFNWKDDSNWNKSRKKELGAMKLFNRLKSKISDELWLNLKCRHIFDWVLYLCWSLWYCCWVLLTNPTNITNFCLSAHFYFMWWVF